ncbi:MAG: RNA polymerase sigma factor [Bacteroidota bacterium]|nr:RNA polymerase sigma factor [Bacteroidota bacterium]MDP4205659.1 RNA polymerase sigma factor [Bacteroidota bacterium]
MCLIVRMDDVELIRQILNGNLSAFRFLVAGNQRLVFHIVGRIVQQHDEIEDVCQEVFIKVYERLHEFRGQSKLSTWIAKIAYHQSINHLRKKKRLNEQFFEETHPGELEIPREKPADFYLEDSDVKKFLLQKIEELPVNYRTVLTLYYLDEFSYREIEDITGMPEGTVKSYLSRAKGILREKLKFVKDDIWR